MMETIPTAGSNGLTDKTTPGAKWEFNQAVTDVFDDMLQRSIPEYEAMRLACLEIGSRYVRNRTDIVDIGCSRGRALEPFVARFGLASQKVKCVGIDVSVPMLEASRKLFEKEIQNGQVQILKHDLRTGLPLCDPSLILSVLTLQFTPMEYRFKILDSIYDSLLPGGALILVEKVIGASAEIDSLFVDLYYQLKGENGYSQEAIAAKRSSLEGVLVPLTAEFNVRMLQSVGFRQVDCFYRYLNFAGWVAVK